MYTVICAVKVLVVCHDALARITNTTWSTFVAAKFVLLAGFVARQPECGILT